jgi:hypothetical protein
MRFSACEGPAYGWIGMRSRQKIPQLLPHAYAIYFAKMRIKSEQHGGVFQGAGGNP